MISFDSLSLMVLLPNVANEWKLWKIRSEFDCFFSVGPFLNEFQTICSSDLKCSRVDLEMIFFLVTWKCNFACSSCDLHSKAIVLDLSTTKEIKNWVDCLRKRFPGYLKIPKRL